METYYGYVRSPADAIKLFEATRIGVLPRVQRRLSEKERQSIRSGSVFVWDEREAGMRRWTDGKSWSASRVSGSFLTYREMEGKRGGGFGTARRVAGKTPDSSGRGSDEDQDDGEPDGYRYKADGLMKQSFSITTSTGNHLHLISYYSRPQPGHPDLPQPSSDPALRHVVPVKGMYPESSLNEASVPAAARPSVNQVPPYVAPHPPSLPLPGSQYIHYTPPGWPPSPVATPPYSHGHYTATAYPHQPPLPPPQMAHYPPQHAFAGPPPYDRMPLPPLGSPHQARGSPHGLAPYAPQPDPLSASPHMSVPRTTDPGRVPPLQVPGAPIDPHLMTVSARNPQGPVLPSISAATGPAGSPPQRALSISPPRSSHSDGHVNGAVVGNKASLSALLHPTPASSEPNSANPGANSAESSPRQGGPPPALNGGPATMSQNVLPVLPRTEDARTKGVLDRKLRI